MIDLDSIVKYIPILGRISSQLDREQQLEEQYIRSQKLMNDQNERKAKREEGLGYINELRMAAQTGNSALFEKGLKRLSKVMPDGETYSRTETDPATGVKRVIISGPDGETPIDLSPDGMFNTVKGLSAKFADPDEFNKSWEEGQAQIKAFNQKSEFAPLDKGKDFRVMFNERTGDKYYEIRDNATGETKISNTIPRTLKQAQGLQADEYALEGDRLKNEDTRAGIKVKKSEEVKNYASAERDKADTWYIKNLKGQDKGGTEKDDDKYDKAFTDAMQKKYGLVLNSRDKKGNLIPQVFPKETVDAMDAWAQKNGYELLVRDNGDNYEVFDYKRLESVQPAPKPSASPSQKPNLAPKQPQYKSMSDRKAANFASQYLNSGDAGRKVVMETVLKNYGPDAWKTVQAEIGRLEAEKKKPSNRLAWKSNFGDREIALPVQGKF